MTFKKFILYLILFLTLATIIGVGIASDPGQVLIRYDVWLLETPLWVALVFMILIFWLLRIRLHWPKWLNFKRMRLERLKFARSHRLHVKIYQDILAEAQLKNLAALQVSWAKMPSHMKKQPELIADYARYLLLYHASQEAEQLLRHTLKKNWHEKLVRLYGFAEHEDPLKQLSWAEHWLGKHPHDAELLLTLGRLCVRLQLWGKARRYLETHIALHPSAEGYYVFAQLLEKIGETNNSLHCYKEGLTLAASGLKP